MNREVMVRGLVLVVVAILSMPSAKGDQAFVISGPLTFYSDSGSGQLFGATFEATVYFDTGQVAEVDVQPFGTTALFRDSVSRITWQVFDENGIEVATRDVVYQLDSQSPRPDEGNTINQQLRSGAQSVEWSLVHQPMNLSYDRASVRFDEPLGGMLVTVDSYVDPLTLWGFAGTFAFEAFDYAPRARQQQGQGEILEISAISTAPADEDGDGVVDGADECHGSDMSTTVFIDDRNSFVENKLLADGCTISDLVNGVIDARKPWKKSIKEVVKLTSALKRDGLISGKDYTKLLKTVASIKKHKVKPHYGWSRHKLKHKAGKKKAVCAKYVRGEG